MNNQLPSATEATVRKRYANAASEIEPALCCAPSDYDADLLANIPDEIVRVDYGCGNPTKWIQPGETVLDLGSGSGKACYLAAQIVGAKGRIIGVDFNEPMLAIARKHQSDFAARVGFDNVTFKKGRIQDLALDLGQMEAWLTKNPVTNADQMLVMEEHAATLRASAPMIESESIDCIISNCVLNLAPGPEKPNLFAEMHRVLKRGGRCVIGDIVSDEDIPQHLQDDPELWSGCISGAFREDRFLQAFEDAGFYGIEIVERADQPWRTIEGIEFRSVTIRAFKGKEGPCLERNQAVIYCGPWKTVIDDDGHKLYRGQRMAVCDKTFNIYSQPPYADSIAAVHPRVEVPLDKAQPFNCRKNARRSPRQSKGEDYNATDSNGDSQCCGPEGDCC